MTLLLAALPAALAGWTATVEAGEASPAELAALAPFLDSCPARPDDWIARYADGALLRFGPVAGHDQRDAEPVEDCLRAALAAKPIAGTAVLRLRWTDPTLDRYRQNVTSVLDQLVGPRSDPGCTTLRFPIQADNTLGAPLLAISSGDPDFDARVTASLALLEGPLPPLPESLRAKLGDTVDVCVQGVRR
ncbi:MAG: hypothetical protein H6739_08905 [Alphaproteobacteria bacterium]|nr:hypothetical protein [Alphaproteobacteria bacterium]